MSWSTGLNRNRRSEAISSLTPTGAESKEPSSIGGKMVDRMGSAATSFLCESNMRRQNNIVISGPIFACVPQAFNIHCPDQGFVI